MFRVGMKVVCIKNTYKKVNDLGLPGFAEGQIFTVSRMKTVQPWGLFLGFAERDQRNLGHHSGFRPVVEKKTDISIFEAMLTPKKETVKA